MNILISNDDGVNAYGIQAISEILSKNYNIYCAG